MLRFKNTILFEISLLVLVAVIGTAGYMVIERWDVLDALYMTVITLTTIGFGETHPLSPAGRLFTILLILGGIGTLTYTLTSISSFFFRGNFYSLLSRRLMSQKIEELRQHVVICGASNTSLALMQELDVVKIPYVLIDQDKDKVEQLVTDRKLLAIVGDATDSKVLKQAGVEKARTLVASLHDDHDNLYLIMETRELNKEVQIFARMKDESSGRKLKRAGADELVNPYEIGGMRLASLIVRPTVVRFLQNMNQQNNGMRIEELTIDQNSPYFKKPVPVAVIEVQEDARLIALFSSNSRAYQIHFDAEPLRVETGDILILLRDRAHQGGQKLHSTENIEARS